MKSLILLTCAMFLLAVASNGQSKLLGKVSKADATINKANTAVNKANGAVNDASTTASNAVATVDSTKSELTGMVAKLGIKKKPLTTTVIKVPGATLGKLKQILAGLKDCPGVDASTIKMVCDDSDQSITLSHKGPTAKLFDALKTKTPLVTDANAEVADGSVIVKL